MPPPSPTRPFFPSLSCQVPVLVDVPTEGSSQPRGKPPDVNKSSKAGRGEPGFSKPGV